MATAKGVIDKVIAAEGGVVNNPSDKGGPTAYGISQKYNADAWRNGPPTEEQARQIYLQKYLVGPGFDKVKDTQLQAQLVDFAVNSGPAVAIMKLQEILHVTVDGVLGPETLAALNTLHPDDVSNNLVASRIRMIGKIVSKSPSQLQFLSGWLDRALQFLL